MIFILNNNNNYMAIFNVAFLNPKFRQHKSKIKSGILSDQLSILQNELEKDGYLSPGDLDILLDEARKLQTTPGLSPSQISKYNVKISNFEKMKSVADLDKKEDLDSLENDTKNTIAQNTMFSGNYPSEWLSTAKDLYQSNIVALQDAIDSRNSSGQDSSEYINEMQNNLVKYREKIDALNALKDFDGKNPIPGYVAYVSTNNNGEITNIDYNKYGANQGYAETNGMINGFQVYGKVNTKQDGKNFFMLGKNIFQAPDMLIPDPTHPGSFKQNMLMGNVQNAGGEGSGITSAQAGGYINIPSEDVSVQSYIPRNSWAKGIDGTTVYKRRKDGKYSRYLNLQSQENMLDGMPHPDQMITIPQSYEKSINDDVTETIDPTEQIQPDQGTMNPLPEGQDLFDRSGGNMFLPKQSQQLQESKQTTAPIRRTPQEPTQKASEGVGSTIQRTIKSGVESFKNLFR